MTLEQTLIIVPFDDVLEEVEPLDSLLWFLDYGFKDMVQNLVITATEEETQFDVIDLNDLYTSRYGKSVNELVIDDLHHFLQIQDRCTTPYDTEHEEEALIALVIEQLVHLVEKKFKLFLKDVSTSSLVSDSAPFWNGNRIVFIVKKF